MAIEQTLSIIKPDAVRENISGKIISMIEDSGLKINQMKKISFSPELASEFYAVHKERPFYQDLVNFMTSGPAIVMELEGDDAISRYRTLMGATNPSDAAPDTIRGRYAKSIDENCVHGSDAPETAATEINLIFS